MAKGDLCAKGNSCKNYGWKQDVKKNLPARVKTNSKYCSDCREILQAMRRKKAKAEALGKPKIKNSKSKSDAAAAKPAKSVIPKREVYLDSEVSDFQESAQTPGGVRYEGSLLSGRIAYGVTPEGERVELRLYNDGSPAGIREESPYSIKIDNVAAV